MGIASEAAAEATKEDLERMVRVARAEMQKTPSAQRKGAMLVLGAIAREARIIISKLDLWGPSCPKCKERHAEDLADVMCEPAPPTSWQLEHFLIPPEEWWNRDVLPSPEGAAKALALVEKESTQGVSAGLGYHPRVGWFVLVTQGQGPVVEWQEREP